MRDVFRFKKDQPVSWFHKQKVLSNQHCLYCGVFVGEGSEYGSNKEHLIGREFVPDGAFGSGKAFNFIFRACVQCNADKADAERHVSSVSLFTCPDRETDATLNALALRKASKDYYPGKNGTVVRDAYGDHKIQLNSFMSFGMISPPQLNMSRTELLAFRHIQGFFSLITSKNPLVTEETCLLSPDKFWFFDCFNHLDWGNPQLLEVARRTKTWRHLATIVTANGFFKLIMRRDEISSTGWFWALEWNKSTRVVGMISANDQQPAIFDNLPHLNWIRHGQYRSREEIPLDPAADDLFVK